MIRFRISVEQYIRSIPVTAVTSDMLTHDNYKHALTINRDDIPEAWVDSTASLMKVTDYGAEHHLMGHTYIAYIGWPDHDWRSLAWETDPDEMKDKHFYRVMGFIVDKDHRSISICFLLSSEILHIGEFDEIISGKVR